MCMNPLKSKHWLTSTKEHSIFHLGVILGHIYHIQMCAPATVMSRFAGCEHVTCYVSQLVLASIEMQILRDRKGCAIYHSYTAENLQPVSKGRSRSSCQERKERSHIA
eukprot:1140534-Pelagomonas_calceolata.AAC.2